MAQQFRFRLEAVQKLREQTRDRQRRVVAEAVQQVVRMEEHTAQLNRELRNSMEDALGDRSVTQIDMLALRENQLYRGWLHRKILEAEIDLSQRNQTVDQERKKLGESSKQLKVIEKLRDRQWQRYQINLQRSEQLMYDEAALQMYVRRSKLHDQKNQEVRS